MIEKDLNAWLQREISTKTDSTIIEQFDDLKEELDEHKSVIRQLRSELNEINLLNTKDLLLII